MPGRPQNPPHLRLASAEAGKRKPNTPGKANAPRPPKWLQGPALSLWWDICGDLSELGTAHTTDANILARYCSTHVQWQEADAEVREHGVMIEAVDWRGRPCRKRNPAVAIADALSKALLAMEKELGLTSLARNRLGAAPQEQADDEDEKMLG